MYGIMSGLEPRGYANGDLVQKALQLGVQPFGMSDEEIMQAISQKQQVDDMSGASADFGKAAEGFKEQFKDYVFDYTDPVDYATAPLYFAGPIGAGAARSIKGARIANKASKAGKNYKPGGVENILTSKKVSMGIPALTLTGEVGYELANEALDDAAEDLEIVKADEEKPNEEKSFDKMKGLAAFAEFASQLGTSPGETEEMTCGQFIPIRPFEAPGVMRMADGGIAQLAKGGKVEALKSGIKALAKKVTPKKKTKTKKKTDKEKETAISKEAPEGDSFIPPELTYLTGKGKEILGKIPAMQNPKRLAARTALYGTPLAMGVSALLPDEETTDPNLGRIADGGGDKDVLDADSSLREFNYAKALERAQAAGRTEPTFVDYVASFPASYTDKLGKDPEFAKQMMAGFVAMMTPTEGIVERSGLADFAGGVMAEQARQEGEIPDQLRLIQEIKENPEILKAMRQLSTATTPADPVADAQAAQAVEDQVLNILYDNKPKKEDKVYDLSGNPIDKNILLQMYRDANGDYSEIIRQVTKK
tara:strand:+ start:361 stop:1965 length:1605 start_codon:yes stop_codon:yes gene_type:complete